MSTPINPLSGDPMKKGHHSFTPSPAKALGGDETMSGELVPGLTVPRPTSDPSAGAQPEALAKELAQKVVSICDRQREKLGCRIVDPVAAILAYTLTALTERAEKAEAATEEEIAHRDANEEMFIRLFEAVTGRSPEFTSRYDIGDALAEAEAEVARLKEQNAATLDKWAEDTKNQIEIRLMLRECLDQAEAEVARLTAELDEEKAANYEISILLDDAILSQHALAVERDELQKTLSSVEEEVAKVYTELTQGRFSKCNTEAMHVIGAVRELQAAELAEAKQLPGDQR